jgi:hypothetical protein
MAPNVVARKDDWMATYQACTDLFLPDGRLIQAGTTFVVPAGWRPPTNAVNPIDQPAKDAYWNEGPRGCDSAEPFRALFTNGSRWSDVAVAPLAAQWVKLPDESFTLYEKVHNPVGVMEV